MVITILKGYMVCLIILIMVYVVRHFVFAVNRLAGMLRFFYPILGNRLEMNIFACELI